MSLRKTFMLGHFYHAYVQTILVKSGLATEDAIERQGKRVWAYQAPPGNDNHNPKPYHWATGFADVAPCNVPGEGEILVDIKTMNSFDFKRPLLPDWAAPKYEAQLNIYMDWFDLERAMILGLCKETGEMKEIWYERNQPLVDAVYQKWTLIGACLEENCPPPEDEPFDLPFQGPCKL